MRLSLIAACTLSLSWAFAHGASHAASTLCTAAERVVFSCPVKSSSKTISVCSSKTLTVQAGYLQYRFGRPGRIELEFPKSKRNTQQQFVYDFKRPHLGQVEELEFKAGGYIYSVFSIESSEGLEAGEDLRVVQGVWVSDHKHQLRREYPCAQRAEARLFEIQSAVPHRE